MTIRPVERQESGTHVALLDTYAGAGIVVAPSPTRDVYLQGPESLLASDWDSLTGRLVRAGWTFLANDYDEPVTVATLPDGSTVHGLYPQLFEEERGLVTEGDDNAYAAALLALLDHYTA